MPTAKERQDAVHAFRILNYFVGDIVAASQIRRLYQSPVAAKNASQKRF